MTKQKTKMSNVLAVPEQAIAACNGYRGHIIKSLDVSSMLKLVTERTFGSAELFGRTSTVQFGPNDRTFSAEHRTFFILHVQGIIISL